MDRTGLRKLAYLPERSSYSYKNNSHVLTAELEGGLSRSRVDIVGGSSRIDCTWNLDNNEFQYFMAFYNSRTKRGANFFLMDLILDRPIAEEFVVKFVPDTLVSSSPSELAFTIAASLEVLPNEQDAFDYWFVEFSDSPLATNSLLDRLALFANAEIGIL